MPAVGCSGRGRVGCVTARCRPPNRNSSGPGCLFRAADAPISERSPYRIRVVRASACVVALGTRVIAYRRLTSAIPADPHDHGEQREQLSSKLPATSHYHHGRAGCRGPARRARRLAAPSAVLSYRASTHRYIGATVRRGNRAGARRPRLLHRVASARLTKLRQRSRPRSALPASPSPRLPDSAPDAVPHGWISRTIGTARRRGPAPDSRVNRRRGKVVYN
jgi:hypothetical protein